MTTNTATPAVALPTQPAKSALRHVTTVIRVLLGLLFFLPGLAFFFNLLPAPKDPMPEGAMAFSAAMMKTGYLLQLVKGTEVIVGALLLLNRFVPLALVLIAPVVVNIVAFHAFLAPSGLITAILIALAEGYLAWAYRDAYRSMLRARTIPA
jgi:uncharacterized membrane protein YphA (DoxX/SURF4 family)